MQFFTRTKIVVKYSVSDFSLNKGKDKWAIKTSSAIKGDIVKAYNDDGLTRLPMDILDAVMPKYKHMNYEHTDGKMRCLFDRNERKTSVVTIFKPKYKQIKKLQNSCKLNF